MTPEIMIALLAAARCRPGRRFSMPPWAKYSPRKLGASSTWAWRESCSIGALVGFIVTALHDRFAVLTAFVAGGLCGRAAWRPCTGWSASVFWATRWSPGLALTIFGTGLAGFFGTPYIGRTAPGFDKFPCPLLSDLPVLGTIFSSRTPWSMSRTFIPPLMWAFFRFTRWGIGLRAAGESPAAAGPPG
jgi:general nucleoside transport system permease protein